MLRTETEIRADPRERARVRGGPEFRDRDAAVLRGREVGRDVWKKKKEAGYHRRSLAERR